MILRVRSSGYIELHALSAFSFLRGASIPEEMIATAASLGQPALAITDHGGFRGTARAHAAAKDHGIHAIVGTTLSLMGGDGHETFLPVLCTNRRGYRSMCRHLTDRAFDGPELLPVAEPGDWIALTGSRDGPVVAPLLRRDRRAALDAAQLLVHLFGRENLFVEISRHHLRDDEWLIRQLADLASHLDLPLVATNAPLHATRRGRRLADVFTCLRHRTTLDRAGNRLAPHAERHLKSSDEMAALFQDRPDAIANTRRIAERCAFSLEDLGYRFPDWHDATGHPLSLPEQSTRLRRLAHEGVTQRFGGPPPAAVKRQLAHELSLIHRLGFSGYFLIVHDIVLFARGRGILCQGRGSAANSIVCFALGITHVDPVGAGLLFERFLSENRRSWPDIDIDFPSGPHREEVIQYVFRKYGARGAAMTANVITWQPRSAIREAAKVLGLPVAVADRFSNTGVRPWDDASLRDPSRFTLLGELAESMTGLPRHLGQHSGGMIICDTGLDRIVPLQPATMPGRHIVQWDKEDCEDLGIVKVDLLGLGMLAAMETTLEICSHRGRPVDLAHIPKDDPAVFDLLGRADTIGTFQVESRAQMATLPVMQPRTFYDVAIEVAIIRPGPIVGDLLHPYLNRRCGREAVDFIHPDLRPVLERTLGVPLFQEQVLRMAMILADFTGTEADELRRAMGSSRSDARMRKMTDLLRRRMTTNHIPSDAQEKVIRAIGSFALYGFPESHAISFALIAYASCWLKVHRTAEFYAGLINHQPMGFYSVNTLIQDAGRHDIRVLPVLCTHSDRSTTVIDDRTLRLGLDRLQGLRGETIERLVEERNRKPFSSVRDLVVRVRPDAKERRLLATSGALQGLPHAAHRREALWQAELPFHDDLFDRAGLPLSSSPLAAMTPAETFRADIHAQGATTGPHLMCLWRDTGLPAAGMTLHTSRELSQLAHGSPVWIAGLVICRQRPSTAKGHCFISLEDEFGIANLFVAKAVFERFRILIGTQPYLLASGIVQHPRAGQVSIRVNDLAPLPRAARLPAPESRDYC